MISKANRHWLIIFIFSISGFTGLIYESVWSHYLKLFLGHAAYAQALVLVIFMGGMAFGSWYAAARSARFKNLLLLYALAEGVIGVFGLFFHQVFDFILQFSYATVLPQLGPAWVLAYKWTLGSLLILPQSFLLGMTFPLLSNGLLRRADQETGWTVSMLYFSNSIGAAIGVIASGFILIKLVGLPGTIMTAAIINILLALIVYLIARSGDESQRFQEKIGSRHSLPFVFLMASFFTGAASFIYEISWIRMLSMVLGSSTHSFELMLSAFILGLALGGYWIRKRIDTVDNPIELAAGVQIMMGLFAISTIPLYNFTHEIMSIMMNTLARSEFGYFFYSVTGHVICLFIMLPATFCAGMTFPLFTKILLQNDYGERSIGYIYSANTLGAIIGVIFTIFIGLPLLGLKGSILLGGGIDILLGFFLLILFVKSIPRYKSLLVLLVCAVVVYSAHLHTDVDKSRLISGVYRSGVSVFNDFSDILFYKDGKTASISVTRMTNNNVVIATNGKPDASIVMGENVEEPSADEITMVMAAALPLSINPDIKQAANIGMGSGLTSQVLLEWPDISVVDTIEIEAAMVEGAREYLPRVSKVYDDPRSQIHIEDAKTFFSAHQKQYDLIISEPSNPWVSGTSNLFTREFYREIKQYLTEDGILLQWLQIYELETRLLMSVMKALHEQFPYFDIYATDNADILIVARMKDSAAPLDSKIFENEGTKKELNHVGLDNIQDFKARYLGDESILGPVIQDYAIQANSDYFPILDLYAERSRFLQQNAKEVVDYRLIPLPLIPVLLDNYYTEIRTLVNRSQYHTFSRSSHTASLIHKAATSSSLPASENELIPENVQAALYVLTNRPGQCDDTQYERLWIQSIYRLIVNTLPYLQPGELKDIINVIKNNCSGEFSVTQLQWLVLYNALAELDLTVARQTSIEMMSLADDWKIEQRRFLFATVLLTSIRQDDHAYARQTWFQYINELYSGSKIPFEMLVLKSLIKSN